MKGVNERFEKIFTNSSLGMLLVNTDNEILMINHSIYKIFDFKNLIKKNY